MKKYFYTIYIFAFIGLVISSILLLDHYIPDLTASFFKCGPLSGCSKISQSPYSEILGIPYAALGFFFYLWILLFTFLFQESSGFYFDSYPYIFLPVAIFGVIFDIYLAGLLIFIKIFCKYCFSTYMVNLILLIVAVFFYRATVKKTNITFVKKIKAFIKNLDENPILKFSSGAFIFLTSILFLFIITFSFYMKEISSYPLTEEKSDDIIMQEYLEEYIDSEKIKIKFPKSEMIIGNKSGLEIIVVTDPFCSACFSFYEIKNEILKKYKDKVYFSYYFYPLDAKCNFDVEDEIYKSSCKASQALVTFSHFSKFENVIQYHYKNYKQLKNVYNRSEFILKYLYDSYDIEGKPEYAQFEKYFNDGSAETQLMEQIKSAVDHNVEATPTMFINGRKIEGTPPLEMFEKIIEFELSESVK